MDYLNTIERNLLKWAYRKPFNNNLIIKSLIFIGDGPFWIILFFIISSSGLLLNNENMYQLSIMLMIGFLLSNIIFTYCKKNIKRKRPYANKELHRILEFHIENRDPGHGSKESESFPSGHVLWTTVCVGIICFKLGYIYFLFIGWLIPVMIFLRLHLGVHYPSDVLAGLVIGIINFIITVLIFPEVMNFLNSYRHYSLFNYGYILLVLFIVFFGYKSWSKRV
ncbi:MAG TPA: phosphatase PAP2 family protein [Spirochaetota bacterium]|nr:phosphatase PAP2 family protein [Spirochaetota bacterium]